jgi:hypothetical protein
VLLTCVLVLQFRGRAADLDGHVLALLHVRVSHRGKRKPFAKVNLQILATFGVVGVLMLGLAAIGFFPSLSLLQNSRRGVEGLPFLETTSWSFHPLQLLEVVVPEFFGSSTEGRSLWSSVLSNRNLPYFLSFFVGFVPIIIALMGLALERIDGFDSLESAAESFWRWPRSLHQSLRLLSAFLLSAWSGFP